MGSGNQQAGCWPATSGLLWQPPCTGWSGGPHTAGFEQQRLTLFWKPQSKIRLMGPDPGGGQGWLPLKAPGEGPPCLFQLLGLLELSAGGCIPPSLPHLHGAPPLCSPPWKDPSDDAEPSQTIQTNRHLAILGRLVRSLMYKVTAAGSRGQDPPLLGPLFSPAQALCPAGWGP